MTDTVTSHNIDLSSWDTMYNFRKYVSQDIKILTSLLSKCMEFYIANVNNMVSHSVSTEHVMFMY